MKKKNSLLYIICQVNFFSKKETGCLDNNNGSTSGCVFLLVAYMPVIAIKFYTYYYILIEFYFLAYFYSSCIYFVGAKMSFCFELINFE